ncbi:MAG: hypothetical protein ACI32E_01435 [Bacilli bacterium]
MKQFFEKLGTWIISHKIASVIIGVCIVSAVATAIIVPVSLSKHEHTFETKWSMDSEYHYHNATCKHTDEKADKALHIWNEGVITKEATETEKGEITYTCKVCNYSKKEDVPVLEHTHTFSDTISYDENYHYFEATCEHDVKKDQEEHTISDWIIDEEPTYSSDGSKHKECTICHYIMETTVIPQLETKENSVEITSVLEKTYDGEPFIIDENDILTNGDGTIIIQYYYNDVEMMTPPVEPGVYKVKVTVEKTDEWESCSIEKNITINLIDTTISLNEGVNLTKAYDGLAFNINPSDIQTNSEGTVVFEWYDETDELMSNAPVNANSFNEDGETYKSYTLIAYVDQTSHYTYNELCVQIVITKKVINEEVTISGVIERDYDENQSSISIYQFTSDIVLEDNVNLIVSNSLVEIGRHQFTSSEAVLDNNNYLFDMSVLPSEMTILVKDQSNFFMMIDNKYNINSRLLIAGVITKGTISKDLQYEISGIDGLVSIIGVFLEDETECNSATKGERVIIELGSEVTYSEISEGQIIATPQTLEKYVAIEAEIYLYTKDEGGRHSPIFSGYKPTFVFAGKNISSVVNLASDVEMMMPGETQTVTIMFEEGITLVNDVEFTLSEGGTTVATGRITELKENNHTFNYKGVCDNCGYTKTVIDITEKIATNGFEQIWEASTSYHYTLTISDGKNYMIDLQSGVDATLTVYDESGNRVSAESLTGINGEQIVYYLVIHCNNGSSNMSKWLNITEITEE